MNKKIFSSLKSKKKFLEEKIEKNNKKIKEYQQQNEELLLEIDEYNKNVYIEIMDILKIKPFEFLDKFFSGENIDDILSISETQSNKEFDVKDKQIDIETVEE